MHKYIFLILNTFFLNPVQISGQGFPILENYSVSYFNGSAQNWDIEFDTSGVMYFGNGSGIGRFDGSLWEVKHVPNATHVFSLLRSSTGTIYYGSMNELGYIGADSLNQYLPISLRDRVSNDLGQVDLGNIWEIHGVNEKIYFRTAAGLVVLRDTSFSLIKTNIDIQKTFDINRSIIVKERNGGLYVLKEDSLQFLKGTEIYGNEKDNVFVLLPFDDKWLIGSRNTNFMLYDGAALKKFKTDSEELLTKSSFYKGIWINDQEFALATLKSGIIIFNKSGTLVNRIFEGNPDDDYRINVNEIYGLTLDHEEQLWSYSMSEINRIQVNIPVRVYEQSMGLKGNINSLEIIDNEIFVRTSFSNFKKGKSDKIFSPISEEALLKQKETQDLKFDFESRISEKIQFIGVIDNQLKIATDGGLYKYLEVSDSLMKDSTFLDRNILNGQVFRFHQDEDGDVWFRSNKRIKFFKKLPNEEYKLVKNTIGVIGDGKEIYHITSSENKVWFAGIENLYELDKNKLEPYKSVFKSNITGIYVNNDSLIYGGFGEPIKPIILSFKDNELRFTYAAASYIDPERNIHRVKLEGYDSDWSNWSLETQKDYTNLREGEYTFTVKGRNVYEIDGKIDKISFTILPPWYRTWWAYTLYALAVGLILYTGYKIRLNQVLKVQRVRNRIADDLHDDVTGTLVGISNFANAAQITQDEQARTRFINLIKETADDTKEKITDIVWAINPEHDDWQSFLAKCRRYASDIFESSGIEYEIDIIENIAGKLTMDLRQNFWLIYKEIVTNIVRHSRAASVFISMKMRGDKLILIAKDDGKGFNSRLQNSGNGVSNIRKRAKQIKAEIRLDTEENKGTMWTIHFIV